MLIRRLFQWLLIAIPLLCGIVLGLCVYLVLLWWHAFVQGYVLGRRDAHP